MKIVTNPKLIRRNAKIGQYTSLGALVVLGIGLWISFTRTDLFTYSLGALLVGFFLSQVGMSFSNKWGRTPRPDEVIDKSLKGLGREYTIYHYVTPVSHMLVGPAGVWTIDPKYQSGTVIYDGKRWRAKGGGFVSSYLRLFGQDNIGRPDLESESEIGAAKKYFLRVLPEGTEPPPVKTALLFVHPKVDLQVNESPLPAMGPKDLNDYLREQSKSKPIGETTLDTIRQCLPQPNKEEE
jgi:hypothetical protein